MLLPFDCSTALLLYRSQFPLFPHVKSLLVAAIAEMCLPSLSVTTVSSCQIASGCGRRQRRLFGRHALPRQPQANTVRMILGDLCGLCGYILS
jgi:hypothetical protein